jgi:hypothetical protein
MGTYPVDPVEEFANLWRAHKIQLGIIEAEIAPESEYDPVIWEELFKAEFELEWLVEGLWPTGKHLHLYAPHKTGKSLLTLWVAACLAIGRDPLTGAPMEAHYVTYVDNEMTPQDLFERLFDMGFTADQLTRLHYHFYPHIGWMDTDEGGKKLMQWIEKDGSDVVILDTLSRVVRGEENSNDTYKNFYNCTGMLLKAAGVAMLRLDHEGHQSGRSRGASSKADDVDLVYGLKRTDDGLLLTMQYSRVPYVDHSISLLQGTEPLTFARSGMKGWPAGTKDRALELDQLGCPEGLTQRKTQAWLRERGLPIGKNAVLTAAQKYRSQRFTMPGIGE